MNGQITNLQRFSVKDGPGIRTTVFLKGCPLKCQWCHNPETQHTQREYGLQQALCVGCRACAGVCPNGAHRFSPDGAHRFDPSACALCGACTRVCPAGAIQLYGKSVSAEAVMQTVLRDKLYYDASGGGMTVSGGEPLAQPDFTRALLALAKDAGIRTAVDTSGCAGAEALSAVEPLTDLFLYDLKLMDDALHRQYTGCGNGQILANYVHLIQSGKTVHVRVPVMEEVNDTAQNWAMLEVLLQRYPPAALRFLPYHTLGAGKYAGLRMNAVRFTPPSAERLEQLAARFSALGILVEKL